MLMFFQSLDSKTENSMFEILLLLLVLTRRTNILKKKPCTQNRTLCHSGNRILIMFEQLVLRAPIRFLINFELFGKLMISIFLDKNIFDSGTIFLFMLQKIF